MGDDDDPSLHLADTLAAGGGLCDPNLAKCILDAGPAAIEALAAFGVHFDRTEQGRLRLALEAAHIRRRIIHAE
ncbi:FAD-binding protein [Bradyrhizobium sp. USDA 3650]